MRASQGWRPADEDSSAAAVDWRSRTALRRADRGLAAVTELAASVEKLNTTIDSWGQTWEKHWQRIGKLLWAIGVPLLVTALVGAGTLVWKWISTLHH